MAPGAPLWLILPTKTFPYYFLEDESGLGGKILVDPIYQTLDSFSFMTIFPIRYVQVSLLVVCPNIRSTIGTVGKHGKDSTIDQSRQADTKTTNNDVQNNNDVDQNGMEVDERILEVRNGSEEKRKVSEVCRGSDKTSYAEVVKGKKSS